MSSIMKTKNILSANIKKYRTKLGLTQEQAAERAGMSVNYWARLEQKEDKRRVLLRDLSKLAKGLNIKMYQLLMPRKKMAR